MKKHLITLGLILTIFTAFSQVAVNKTSDWKLIYENQDVKMYSKYVNCEIPEEGLYAEYILLKAENLTDQSIQLSWFNDTYYPGTGCSNCDHNNTERKFNIELAKNEVKEGNCLPGNNNGLKIISKWLRTNDYRVIDKVIVTGIKTQNISQ